MKRYVTLNEISDGRLYTADDLVRAGCHNCSGCDQCCHDMGRSIILDPWDIHHLVSHLSVTFEMLLQHAVELNVADGVILPNLRMHPENGSCYFLDENHRCSIHSFRPGLCRLFPLGRYYEDDSFKYILQTHECPAKNKTKVRIRSWLEIDDLAQYESYIQCWHQLLKQAEAVISAEKDQNAVRQLNVYWLKLFYMTPYNSDFYNDFYMRADKIKSALTF